MKKLFVFDLDGTLVDSVRDIADAVNYSLRQMNKPEFETEAYYKMVGNGMELLCRRALPGGSEEEVKTLVDLYKERYIKNCCNATKPYDGIKELLRSLKEGGAKLAILSNKPQPQTDEVAAKLLGTDLFWKIIGKNDRFVAKPEPDSLNYLIECAGVDKAEVCYIGDSNVDIELGKRGNVDTIGAQWGFRGRKELEDAGAAYIAENPAELKEIIDKMQK